MAVGPSNQSTHEARVAEALARKPTLRAALADARPWDRTRLDEFARVHDGIVERGVMVRQQGFSLALTFGARTSMACLAADMSWKRVSPADVVESVLKRGIPDDVALDNVPWRQAKPIAERLPVVTEATVMAIEAIGDGVAVLDPEGTLSEASHQATLAAAREDLLAPLRDGSRALVAHLLRADRDLDVGLAAAIHLATRVEAPERVLQAILAAPVLEALLHPTNPFPDRGREALADVAGGRSPYEVVRNLFGYPADVPAVVLRSTGNLPHATKPGDAAIEALTRFHVAHPRHRALDTEETASLAHAAGRLRWPAIARCLLDGHGRVAAVPAGLADAVRSLEDSIDAIAVTLGSRWFAAPREISRAVAFPPWRRHASLVRIDREWHAGTGRRERSLATLRDEVLSGGGGATPEGEFPHLTRAAVDLDGVVVTPLLTHEAYLREGEDMGHCVASYAKRAWAGRIVGFSLRDGNGRRSTLTFDVGPKGGLSDVEHTGAGNAATPQSHARIVDGLVRSLSVPGPAVEGVLRVRQARYGVAQEGTVLPRSADDGQVRRYLDLYFGNVRHWLPPSEAGMTVEAWWAMTRERHARA